MKIILTKGEIDHDSFIKPITDMDYLEAARRLIALQFPNYDIELLVGKGVFIVPMNPNVKAYVEFDVIPYEDL